MNAAGREGRLAMFPLESVLVPAAVLPLHVFEARYRALMADVLEADPPEFGVVLIERGSEVGGGDVRTPVGTVARVVEARQAPDGRWAVVAVGTRRLDVEEWLPDDPYPAAVVRDRPERAWTDRAAVALREGERAVRQALALKAELGDRAPAADVELASDPATRAWQLVAVAPIAVLDRQRLLTADDPGERLSALVRLVEEETEVLAYRLRGL